MTPDDCPINWDGETDRMLAGDDGPCWTCGGRGCPDCIEEPKGPSLFWLDLADDLRDPAFRRAYEAGWREALKARDTAYDDDRCACTECLIELLPACPTCTGSVRETVGMVCQTCGTDYAKRQGER